jgi:hypothetical protein
VGATKVINGYLYVKVEEDKWTARHRLIVEEQLGRALTKAEYIRFKDGNRTNLDPSNLVVHLKNKNSILKQIESLKSRIAALQQEVADLESCI